MPIMPTFFVITGGPSSGKTTLIHALEQQGYACMQEAARAIFKQVKVAGTDIVAFRHTSEFTMLEFEQSLENYTHAQKNHADTITFFDRGIIDVLVYARFRHIPITAHMHDIALTYRYNKTVFIAPPWQAIYALDAERTESFEEAVRIYEMHTLVYREYGYDLIELPLTTVPERVQFIVDCVHTT